MSTTTDNSVGYGALIRNNRNFRFLWSGEVVSLLGDWFNLIASASLVAILTGSGTAVGGLFVLRMLAPFVTSPIAGVMADRYNRKRILVLTDLTRAITVLGFLLVRDAGDIWLLYTLTALQLGISGFFFPTRTALLPDIVSDNELGAANAMGSATWSVMLAVGAAIGGLVSGTWGNYPAFVLDSLTFLISAIFIGRITYQPSPGLQATGKSIPDALQQYLNGLRYLRDHAAILIISLHKGAISLLVTSGLQVLQVTIAEKIFVVGRGGGVSLGFMYGIAGVGTGLGPILARHFTGDRNKPLRLTIILGYLLAALGLFIVAPLKSLGLVLLGTLLRGLGGGIVWVFSTQLLLTMVPGHIRGRVFATEYAIFTLLTAAGAAGAGRAADSPLGISGTLYWMAGLALIPGVLWTLWLALGSATKPAAGTSF